MKELVWEAGGNEVKWVCHGTPAAGNGVVGLLEMGCNVLTLCQDDHHKEHFIKTAVEKAAETCLGGRSPTFGNPALLLRARELNLVKKEIPKEIPKDKEPKKKEKEIPNEKEKEKEKEKAKEKAKAKEQKKKQKHKSNLPVAKKQKVEKSSSSSPSSSSAGS